MKLRKTILYYEQENNLNLAVRPRCNGGCSPASQALEGRAEGGGCCQVASVR